MTCRYNEDEFIKRLMETRERCKTTPLYHATFESKVPSILNMGLCPGFPPTYDDFIMDGVYLATARSVAESYAEVSDYAENNENELIVLFEVMLPDTDKLLLDPNVICAPEEVETFCYCGVIPPHNLQIVT